MNLNNTLMSERNTFLEEHNQNLELMNSKAEKDSNAPSSIFDFSDKNGIQPNEQDTKESKFKLTS